MKTKRLRHLCSALRREELLEVVKVLIASCDRKDKATIARIVDELEHTKFSTIASHNAFRANMLSKMSKAIEMSPLEGHIKDIIVIARDKELQRGGANTRDILLELNSQFPNEAILPITEVPSGYKDIIKWILTIVGFKQRGRYIKTMKRTENAWHLMPAYHIYTMEELAENLIAEVTNERINQNNITKQEYLS